MWELALYFAIAGLSTYAFLREWRLHRMACEWEGQPHALWLRRDLRSQPRPSPIVAACLPLVMLCAERWVRRGSARSLAAAAVVVAIQFLSGHPSLAVVTVVATSVDVAFVCSNGVGDDARGCPPSQERWLSGWGPGSSPSLPVWASGRCRSCRRSCTPDCLSDKAASASSTRPARSPRPFAGSDNSSSRTCTRKATGSPNRPPGTLQSGTASGMSTARCASSSRHWPSGGDGAGPIQRRPSPHPAPSRSALLSARRPRFSRAVEPASMNGFRYPGRFLIWAAFCLSCLAALGVHRLIVVRRTEMRVALRLKPFAMVAFVVIALAIAAGLLVPAGRSGILLSLSWLAAGIAISTAIALSVGRVQIAMVLLAVCVAIADLGFFRAHGHYARSVPFEEALSPPSHVEFLKHDPEPFRVIALTATENGAFTTEELRDFVQADLSTIWGIDSSDVYLSLFLKRHFAVRSSIVEEILRRPEAASTLASFLAAMNVKYMVAPVALTIPGWDRVHEAGSTAVWKNPVVLPRAFLVGSIRPQRFELQELWRQRSDQRLASYAATVSDWASRRVDAQIVDHVMAEGLDYGRAAEVLDGQAIDVGELDREAAIRTRPSGPDEMRFSITSSRPAYLVISSSFYPGWTATLNGRPARLFETNWVMTGLAVPAGTSDVILRYRTPGFRTGLLISVTLLLVLASLLVWPSPLQRLLKFIARDTSSGLRGTV